MTKVQLAYRRGHQAFVNQVFDDNPYRTGSPVHQAYVKGFEEARSPKELESEDSDTSDRLAMEVFANNLRESVSHLVPSPPPRERQTLRRLQQTADAAGFLWRNGHGMWNASSLAHLQGYLRGSSVGRIIDDAEDLQLTIATATADKVQSVLVGYVAQAFHYPRCPCKVCTP